MSLLGADTRNFRQHFQNNWTKHVAFLDDLGRIMNCGFSFLPKQCEREENWRTERKDWRSAIQNFQTGANDQGPEVQRVGVSNSFNSYFIWVSDWKHIILEIGDLVINVGEFNNYSIALIESLICCSCIKLRFHICLYLENKQDWNTLKQEDLKFSEALDHLGDVSEH